MSGSGPGLSLPPQGDGSGGQRAEAVYPTAARLGPYHTGPAYYMEPTSQIRPVDGPGTAQGWAPLL